MDEQVLAHEQLEEREEGLDFREYWRVVNRHKWGILSITLLCGVLAALVAYSLEPVYRATATLLIESKSAKVVSIEEVYGLDNPNREYYQTQYEILKSHSLGRKVVESLGLWKHPQYDPAKQAPRQARLNIDWRAWLPAVLLPEEDAEPPTKEQRKEATTGAMLDKLAIQPVLNSHLVKISFDSPDRALTYRVANELAVAYIESNLEARLQMTKTAASWLTERLAGLRKKLEKSETALQTFHDRERLVDVKGVDSLTASRLGDLSSKLVEARGQRTAAEAVYKQVRALRGKSSEQMESIPAVIKHPLVNALKQKEAEAERRISELAKRYGPQHPKMIAARSNLEVVRKGLKKRIATVVSGVAKEYEAARAGEAELVRSLAGSKKEMRDINRKKYRLGVLEREVETNRQLYELFMTRFKETSATGDMHSANARVVDPARLPGAPFKPKKPRIVILTLLVALVLTIMLAFLLERLDNTLKTTEDVEARLLLPVLGMFPRLKTRGRKDKAPLRHFLDKPKTNFAESVRTVRTGILLSGLDDPHKVIVVTSSVPGEGKTTVSMNLAFAMGHLKKVLLVDADMRRPSIGEACGLEPSAVGLSHLVAGAAQVSDCVHHIEDTHVHVIPAGIVPPNPLELLSSRRFRDVLEKLGQAFDHIILDTAPTLAVSDALVVASHANGVVYVAKADATPYQAAQVGVKRLRQADAPLIGVVLNQVAARKPSSYGGYGYYEGDYYTHYGYTERR